MLILSLAGGIAASLLSGTRGAWIPLLLLPLALMTPLNGFLKQRYIFAIILVFVAVFSSFYFVLRSDTQARLLDVGKHFRNYFIALHYLDHPIRGTPADPVCVDDKTFLQAWLNAGRSIIPATTRTLSAEVVTDQEIGGLSGCKSDYAVRLQNGNNSSDAQYILPRLPGPPGSDQHSKLLARGAGTLAFLGGKTTENFSNQSYKTVSMNDKKTPAQVIQVYIKVTIPPDKTVWLVPLDGYFGEYSLSIANTSIGGRFELWRSAWRQFMEHPWLGAGTGAFQAMTLQFISAGIIAPFANIYDHPHNDYLDALASHGIFGLIVLLAVFLVPAGFFMRAVRRPERVLHALGLAGVLTVAGFAIYALTDTIFLHTMMITWYVIYVALFYALLDVPAKSGPDGQLIE
ncbi:MAG: O-antigen ligase family protein [Gammaproteobacteria bacterium]|nr:O-antigen ligase family protein [Gammaproteobacteria bacterium]